MTNLAADPIGASLHGCFAPYPSDVGLDALFARQVEARPQALAIDSGSELVSYAELDARASRLAHELRRRGVGRETPVGVLMGPRVEQIVAQVAIIKAGATYVPLDPDYPRERLALMIADAGIDLVVTDAVNGEVADALRSEKKHARLSVDGEDAKAIERHPSSFPFLDAGPSCRTHVLFTSGSTGKPKGIEIVARNVTRLVKDTDYVDFGPTDRVAQMASLSFDASIFEIWGALLNGSTIVIVPKRRALDPHALRVELSERRVSVMFMTTSLFHLTAQSCPDAFAGVRYVIIGGERANPDAMRAVLEAKPPRHLVNGYGPTEGTTFSTACHVTLEALAGGSVPLGRPIRNTLVYILDESRRPVKVGEPGEIYIGGDGIARGYLNRPELTAERFVTVEGLRSEGAVRLYRTGDQARWRTDGMIEFLGRNDFQVKVRGHRIELEEVEAAIVATGQVKIAAVSVHESSHGDKSLVAHVVPLDASAFRGDALQAALAQKLPAYMVPERVDVRDALPLNANGKVDRTALASAARSSGGGAARPTPHEVAIAALWAAILDVPKVTPNDSFFSLGGTSLSAARMVLQVRDLCRADFPLQALYESDRLRDFAAVVRAAQKGALPVSDVVAAATFQADAKLPSDVREMISAARPPERGSTLSLDTRLLLTGATGFLGAFLLRELLVKGHRDVRCLVRAPNEQAGLARIRSALRKYDLWDEAFSARVRAVPGDLRQLRFGLDGDAFATLADSVDAVIHSAAQVNYVQTYAAHRPTNVAGTTEVLRFAAANGKLRPLHHVSSIAVFGPSGFFDGERRIREDQDLDAHVECLRYDIGYSASKWVAEKLVWEAKGLGLPVRVLRPGFIMGDSRTGAGNADDFVGRAVRGMVQIGACPDLPYQRKEFVPVDYVTQSILAIGARSDTEGRAFHLVPPDPTRSVDLNDFHELLRQCGYPLEDLPYRRWVERLIDDCRNRDNPLCSLLPMLSDPVHERWTRWELYERMPVYDASNAIAALRGTGIEHVYMDRDLLTKYLSYWWRTGQLAPPHAAATTAAA